MSFAPFHLLFAYVARFITQARGRKAISTAGSPIHENDPTETLGPSDSDGEQGAGGQGPQPSLSSPAPAPGPGKAVSGRSKRRAVLESSSSEEEGDDESLSGFLVADDEEEEMRSGSEFDADASGSDLDPESGVGSESEEDAVEVMDEEGEEIELMLVEAATAKKVSESGKNEQRISESISFCKCMCLHVCSCFYEALLPFADPVLSRVDMSFLLPLHCTALGPPPRHAAAGGRPEAAGRNGPRAAR